MNTLRAMMSMPVPFLCVVVATGIALFAGTYSRMIVGEEYHHFSMLLGFLLAAGVALACMHVTQLAAEMPAHAEVRRRLDELETEREQREKEGHQARMEAHRASMERHEAQMVLARLEAKRLRQLIRQDKREW